MDLKTTSFEDIIGRLKAYEERVSEEEETSDEQSKLMYASSEQQYARSYNNENRGRVVEEGSLTREEVVVAPIMGETQEMHRESRAIDVIN